MLNRQSSADEKPDIYRPIRKIINVFVYSIIGIVSAWVGLYNYCLAFYLRGYFRQAPWGDPSLRPWEWDPFSSPFLFHGLLSCVVITSCTVLLVCRWRNRRLMTQSWRWLRNGTAKHVLVAAAAIAIMYPWLVPIVTAVPAVSDEQSALLPDDVKNYFSAALKGNQSAITELGFIFDEGRGVPVNQQEAVRWYETALKNSWHGNAEAKYRLAVLYDKAFIGDEKLAEIQRRYGMALERYSFELLMNAVDDGHLQALDKLKKNRWYELRASMSHH